MPIICNTRNILMSNLGYIKLRAIIFVRESQNRNMHKTKLCLNCGKFFCVPPTAISSSHFLALSIPAGFSTARNSNPNWVVCAVSCGQILAESGQHTTQNGSDPTTKNVKVVSSIMTNYSYVRLINFKHLRITLFSVCQICVVSCFIGWIWQTRMCDIVIKHFNLTLPIFVESALFMYKYEL